MPALPYSGSSPRGRGTQVLGDARDREHRSIPARAGNTTIRTFPPTGSTVHPRAGGEHCPVRWCSTGGRRFIPARAGNTSNMLDFDAEYAVHPRAGGEHGYSVSLQGGYIGSSPRGRGTRPRARDPEWEGRFIPALGERTALAVADAIRKTGSSPRWGGWELKRSGGIAAAVG